VSGTGIARSPGAAAIASEACAPAAGSLRWQLAATSVKAPQAAAAAPRLV
jgi:hypothetical protein